MITTMAPSSSSSSAAAGGSGDSSSSSRDPMGYLTSPPSVVVKVVGTARDDINGLLGIVLSYNTERERYLVHMTSSQSTMALKKENIARASFTEKYRCQWQQLKNDPRVREKMAHYYRWCELQVRPYKPWHVAAALALATAACLYLFGFTRCVMTASLVLLLFVIVLPDLSTRAPPRVMLRRFPQRSREALEQQLPFFRGRLSDRTATAVIMVLVAFTLQSLFVSRTSVAPPKVPASPPRPTIATTATAQLPVLDKEMIEKYYNLGFQDATDGKDRGFSIQEELEKLSEAQQRSLAQEEDPLDDGGGDFDYYPPPRQQAPPKSMFSRLVSFSSLGSMFYIFRVVKEKGTDSTTNLFSLGQLAANLQHHTEFWQQAMLLFSVFNLMRTLVSW